MHNIKQNIKPIIDNLRQKKLTNHNVTDIKNIKDTIKLINMLTYFDAAIRTNIGTNIHEKY